MNPTRLVGTGQTPDWEGVGAIYPLVGWEVPMLILCASFCIGFMIWKFRTESAGYEARAARLRDPGALERATAVNPLANPSTRDDSSLE